ncbi:MAG: DUF6114 domain-containing protein [Thermoplasmata archaeon]
MAGEKPTAAMVLSIIGGIFILLGGVVFLALASLMQLFIDTIPGLGSLEIDPVLLLNLVGALGVIIGLVIIVGGVMMYSRPQSSTVWGVLILVLAIVSLFVASGGFILGFVLALIGGILAIAFKSTPVMPAPAPVATPPPTAPAPAPAPAPEPEEPVAKSDEE